MNSGTVQRVEDSQELRYRFMEMEDRYRKQALAMACTLVSLVDLRDAYTGGHSGRVASYARAIALRLGLQDTQLDNVVMAALLHDIGKIGVPDHVLLKKGKLTADVAMTGLLTDKARMVRNSMKGSVNFSIKDGQLIDFEPMGFDSAVRRALSEHAAAAS